MSLNVCAMRDGKAVASITLESRKGKIFGLTVQYEADIALPYHSTLDYLIAIYQNNLIQLDSDCFDIIPESERESVVFYYVVNEITEESSEMCRQFVSELETLKRIAEIEELQLVIN